MRGRCDLLRTCGIIEMSGGEAGLDSNERMPR